MKSRTTWRLFFAAIALFAFIHFFESRSRRSVGPAPHARIFQKIDARAVGVLEIRASNLVIRAERTNETWRLTTPFYPAQSTPIDLFVRVLADLPKLEVITASEVSTKSGKLKDFGLDPPLAILSMTQGSNRFNLHIGSRTPIVDQLYAQVPGSTEVLMTDLSILKVMPQSANEWRSAMLLQMAGRPFDHMQIRAGQRLLEFERDPTNVLWRISKPTPARANTERITQILQRLNTTEVKQFVSDSPAADLERYGLQPPELELSFSMDTNRVAALEFGGSPTNDPGSVYVRRPSTTNIVLVARDLLDALNQPHKAYHDPRLLSFDPAQLSSIEVNGTNGFTVVLTNGLWQITAPKPLPVDAELMRLFIRNLQEMEIADFAKDVPTDDDLKQFGLAPAQFSIGLFTTRTNASGASTNTLLLELDLGGTRTEDTIYARRTDETPVYVTPNNPWLFPRVAWKLRDRRVFNFAGSNVTALAVSWRGQTNRIARSPQGWVADPIKNLEVEEMLHRLGELKARNWTDQGMQRLAQYGFAPDGLAIEATVTRDGAAQPIILQFGKRGIRNNVYAATILPGDTEPTLFEFPGELHQQLLQAFNLPAQ